MTTVAMRTIPPTTDSAEVKLPEIVVQKLVVWKTADGVYYEKAETCRQAMVQQALVDFSKVNGITDVTALTTMIAGNIDRITELVDASLKKIAL